MGAVQPTLNVASGGVSIYEGLTPVAGSSLLPAGAVPAGAGLPWDETSAAKADGFCGEARPQGGVCHARPYKSDALGRCYGHCRSDATVGTNWTSSTLNVSS